MDLALNNLQRLICHKTQQTNQPFFRCKDRNKKGLKPSHTHTHTQTHTHIHTKQLININFVHQSSYQGFPMSHSTFPTSLAFTQPSRNFLANDFMNKSSKILGNICLFIYRQIDMNRHLYRYEYKDTSVWVRAFVCLVELNGISILQRYLISNPVNKCIFNIYGL